MKKGFVLITCLAVVVVVAIGAATILQAVGSHANMKAINLQDVQAKYLAEAGMEYALWRCRPANGGCTSENSPSIDGTTVPIVVTSLGGGMYSIQTSVTYTDI